MSRKRRKCKASKILHDLEQEALHTRGKPRRHMVYNPYTKEYVSRKTGKKRYLQTVLAGNPDKYDSVWVGDEIDLEQKKYLRFWLQNSNSLVKNGDLQEFQFDIANLADAGENYFSFMNHALMLINMDMRQK